MVCDGLKQEIIGPPRGGKSYAAYIRLVSRENTCQGRMTFASPLVGLHVKHVVPFGFKGITRCLML